jgi:hypothetical protein
MGDGESPAKKSWLRIQQIPRTKPFPSVAAMFAVLNRFGSPMDSLWTQHNSMDLTLLFYGRFTVLGKP